MIYNPNFPMMKPEQMMKRAQTQTPAQAPMGNIAQGAGMMAGQMAPLGPKPQLDDMTGVDQNGFLQALLQRRAGRGGVSGGDSGLLSKIFGALQMQRRGNF